MGGQCPKPYSPHAEETYRGLRDLPKAAHPSSDRVRDMALATLGLCVYMSPLVTLGLSCLCGGLIHPTRRSPAWACVYLFCFLCVHVHVPSSQAGGGGWLDGPLSSLPHLPLGLQ